LNFTINTLRRVFGAVLAAAALCASGRAQGYESNAWPFAVEHVTKSGQTDSWTAAGPFLFKHPDAEGSQWSGLRPLWVQRHNAQGDFRAGFFLYPLFSYTVDENTYKWSVFELIRRTNRRAIAGGPRSIFDEHGEFEIFPFWFSRVTGDPSMSYRALFPVYGTVKNKLTFERLSWVLAPLYVENERRGAVTTYTPWPFIRVTRGAAHGWGVWPLYNVVDRPGVSHDEYFLWPLGYNHVKQPRDDAAPGTPPRHDYGFLPFYAKSTGPGYFDENYVWPFFGRTDRDIPSRYSEVRYFWPFLVQGRGDDRFVNRWAPFYTHSVSKGYDKTWYAWPIIRHAEWKDAERDVAHERTQFLYFLYWSEKQTRISRTNAAPAELRHVWPLFSTWDNGAGRRQFQAFSPFDVFFPGNEKFRETWTPFVAVLRHEERGPDESRTTALWNFISWERSASEARRELHIGPLFSSRTVGESKRVAIGNGLFGFQREDGASGWRMFWLDFRRKSATNPPSAR
jgi:hypothetical protein